MKPEAHITTFYSFKGGVGRTMLLANVGAALALKKGRRVLLWDLDVEAPGMHLIPALTPRPAPPSGFLEWLLEVQRKNRLDDPGRQALREFLRLVKPVPGVKGLHILPAFGDGADASGLYLDIRWEDFLVHEPALGVRLFRRLLESLEEKNGFDHILLDSRTGVTDLGGLLSAILPHATVLVGSYGPQNLAGVLRTYRALQPAVDGRNPLRKDPSNLQRLIVVSPVPEGREDMRTARREAWRKEFPGGLEEILFEIPFDGRLLYSDELLALSDPASLAASRYLDVAAHIDNLRGNLREARREIETAEATYPDVQEALDRRSGFREGRTFEDRVARLLELLDYRVEREQLVDGGRVDLIARKQAGLRHECYMVECEGNAGAVGKEVVEKVLARLSGRDAAAMRAEGMVVAPSFSPAALTFAGSSGILTYTPRDMEKALFDFGPYLARLRRRFEESELARTYVPQRVLPEAQPESRGGVDLLDHAMKWATGRGKRLWLLLGDYGTGKTSFFRRFSYELAKLCCEADPEEPPPPIPIAVDLKEFPNAISLEGLLQEHFRVNADWHGNPEILLHLLAAGRVVLLLDAFDEMGTAAAGRSIEDQFRMLARPASYADSPRGNRVLVTCRTHFFRDQQMVKDVVQGVGDHLAAQDSNLGRIARSFDASIDELMLFNEEQIEQFLDNHLSATDAKKAREFIRNTYDLPRLAPRPVLLEMIVKSLPRMLETGEGLNPAGLYHSYISGWLEDRSGRSLQTTPAQRTLLLETLAFELWGRPQNRIHHRELIEVLKEVPPEGLAGLDLDRVDLELRTAAFLTRSHDGYYSFSHKSFLEFFYARHLLRALRKGAAELAAALETVPLTPECRDFLVDMVESPADGEALKACLRRILESAFRPLSSENAFRLAYGFAQRLSSGKDGPSGDASPGPGEAMKSMVPLAAQLQGAQLKGEALPGAWLRGADFSGARLDGADLRGADLSSASFRKANLAGCMLSVADCRGVDFSEAVLRNVNARVGDFAAARFHKANLTASVFVDTNCAGADFTEADCHAARFARAILENSRWDGAQTARMTCPDARPCVVDMPCPETPAPYLHLGHADYVVHGDFSPDGRTIVTASLDGTARLWDFKSRGEVRRFEGHSGWVHSAVFSPDGLSVVSAGGDRSARVWSIESGKEIRRFMGHDDQVDTAVFSPDGLLVLTAGRDKTARIWCVESGKEIRRFMGHDDQVNTAVFSPDGLLVLTAGADKTARIWCIESGREILRIQGHDGAVNTAVFSTDGNSILTASDDKSARIWQTESGREIHSFDGHDGIVSSAVFSRDGFLVLTFSADSTARIWDVETGREKLRLHTPTFWARIKRSAVFSHDSRMVLLPAGESSIKIVDSTTGEVEGTFGGRGLYPWSAIYSLDGRCILFHRNDGSISLWDSGTGVETRRIEENSGAVSSAFSPDGHRIFTVGFDGTVRIWDLETACEVRRFGGATDAVCSGSFSPDGRKVLTAGRDGKVRMYEITSGRVVQLFDGHLDWVRSAVFSPDGRTILTAGDDGTARTWNAQTGKELQRFQGHRGWVRSAVFSPDGRIILTAGDDGTAKTWNAQSGKEVQRFERHDDRVLSAVFSHDGSTALTAGNDGTARTWDAQSGREIKRFQGHGGSVFSVVYSPDGLRVLTASRDGTARIWDAESARCLRTLVSVEGGWFSLDERGRYRGNSRGLECLSYCDPNEKAILPTFWHAEDLPWMAADHSPGE